jgi:hypothetical protein
MLWQSQPYLWIHLIAILILPLYFLVIWLGWAVSYPLLPLPLEVILSSGVPIAIQLWRQLTKPDYFFSWWLITQPPAKLTPTQQRILTITQGWRCKLGAILSALIVLSGVYFSALIAPLVSHLTPVGNGGRFIGLAIVSFGTWYAFCCLYRFVNSLIIVLTKIELRNNIEPISLIDVSKKFNLPSWQLWLGDYSDL